MHGSWLLAVNRVVEEGRRDSPYWSIVFSGLVASGVLFVFRFALTWQALHSSPDWQPSVYRTFRDAMHSSGGDALAIGWLILGCVVLAGRFPRLAKWVSLLALGAMILLGAVNVEVALLYSQPANISLMHFAGLDGLQSAFALTAYADGTLLALLAFAVFGTAILLIVPGMVGLAPLRNRAVQVLLIVVFCMWFGVTGQNYLEDRSPKRAFAANAGWWMLKSLVRPAQGMKRVKNADPEDPFALSAYRAPPIAREGFRPVSNVVVVVLESVGSGYLDLERWPERTPRLAAMRGQMAYFPNTYAAMPSTSVSLAAILSGMYPMPAPDSVARLRATHDVPTLARTARASGRRTALFLAATRYSFGDAARFAQHHGIDLLEDSHNRPCPGDPRPSAQRTESSDLCTFRSLEKWIAGSTRPFFAIVWTNETHFPYVAAGKASTMIGNPTSRVEGHRRYLDRIRDLDFTIGAFVDRLGELGKVDDTLIVVVGDHGEAFGQHDNWVHGSDVYEESIKVPLMFVNPRLFIGTVSREPVRMIDLVPTTTRAMGLGRSTNEQGLDLFRPERPQRAFFAAPWTSMTVGYRDGDRKYVYRWVEDDLRAFDLARDPAEKTPLKLSSAERDKAKWRLSNWATVAGREVLRFGGETPRGSATAPE